MACIHSMTGFASAQGDISLGHVTVEVRCVNSRYLDLNLKICEELRFTEPALRQVITARVKRGSFECRISLKSSLEDGVGTVNVAALTTLKNLQSAVLSELPDARALSVIDVLSYPGILANNAADPDVIQNELLAVLDRALESFCASRQREGKALADVLLKNCDQIDAVVANVAVKIPEIHSRFREKLAERLQEAMSETLSKNSTLSPEEVADRIRQEVTLYALRMDVEEEINRLRTHVAEVRRVLAAGGAAGRRLDFLTQELNREANTLGSKAAAIAMTDASIALKLAIDQMREQLQNIE